MSDDYNKKRLAFINKGRPKEKKKVRKRIRPISKKRAKEMADAKKVLNGGISEKEKWFLARNAELTGTCQCGCGKRSQKDDEMYFRHSCCHVFPKKKFKTIALHPINCVERAFFGGCHFNMDERSLDKWPQMADWDDVKERFHVLAPLLTDRERASKFYKHLEQLVYAN